MTDNAPADLLLLGAGHAHVHVLEKLARLPRTQRARWQVTLVSPHPVALYSNMLPGFVAGHYDADDCTMGLHRLIENSGVRHLPARAMHIDAAARSVQVYGTHSGQAEVAYRLLSIDTGGVMDRARLEASIPGITAHGHFLRPIESFVAEWQRIQDQIGTEPRQLAVVGGGAGGVELALALRHRLPDCGVQLVTGGGSPMASHPVGVQRRAAAALARHGVTVHPLACTGLTADSLRLSDDSTHPCDVALVAVGAQAPRWLARSGLTLDGRGFLAVNGYQQSLGHPEVFAAGDVSSRVDGNHPRSGAYAAHAGTPLAINLLAALDGKPMTLYTPPPHVLNLFACGEQRAIASWRRWYWEGEWLWRWKDRLDRAFVARFGH